MENNVSPVARIINESTIEQAHSVFGALIIDKNNLKDYLGLQIKNNDVPLDGTPVSSPEVAESPEKPSKCIHSVLAKDYKH